MNTAETADSTPRAVITITRPDPFQPTSSRLRRQASVESPTPRCALSGLVSAPMTLP